MYIFFPQLYHLHSFFPFFWHHLLVHGLIILVYAGHNDSSNQLTSEPTSQVISHQPPDFLYHVPHSDGFQQVVSDCYMFLSFFS